MLDINVLHGILRIDGYPKNPENDSRPGNPESNGGGHAPGDPEQDGFPGKPERDMGGACMTKEQELQIRQRYCRITETLIEKKETVTTMESCTAGLIASLLTDTEGSSAILKGAFVTYSNEAKVRQGVPEGVIAQYGVYSEETARAMAKACREAYRADIGLGITGTMGNKDPENADSIPGEVFYAVETNESRSSFHASVPPQQDRHAWKMAAAALVAEALERVIKGGVD